MIWKTTGLITIIVMSSFFTAAQTKRHPVVSEVYADTLLERQDFQGAVDIMNKLVERSKLTNDEDHKILYKRAYAYYNLGQFENALKDINIYLEKFSDQQALLLRTYLYQELGDYEAVLKDLNAFILLVPGNPDLLRWRASVFMETEKYQEAQKDIRTLMAAGQPDPELQLYLGLSHYYLNNTDSAFMEFDKVIARDPSFIQAYLYAGSILLEDGFYDQALHYINKGLQRDPANTTLLYYKGVALVEQKNVDAGCSCFRKAFYNGFDDAADYLKEYCFGETE